MTQNDVDPLKHELRTRVHALRLPGQKQLTHATMKAFAVLIVSALLSSSPEPLRQDFPDPIKQCYKVTSKSCTSCSPETYDDDECKEWNAGPYSGCIDDQDICGNSARCDADQGTGEC